jgi:hypothetical protein
LWLPKKLEEQLAILNSHPDVAMVYGRTEYFHTGTGHGPEEYRMRFVLCGQVFNNARCSICGRVV